MKKLHTKKWFLNRIGKVIRREEHKCCHTCQLMSKVGVKIASKEHAEYLFNIQNDFAGDGHYLNYIDEK